MPFRPGLIVPLLLSGTCLEAELANSARGAELLVRERCVDCHRLDTPSRAGVFERLLKKQLTPTSLVGAIWQHAPSMWKAGGDGLRPAFTRAEALDLIIYFAARGFFETPGDARQGASLYRQQGCIQCHNGSDPSAPALENWTSVESPIDLFHAIWRHAPHMKAALDRKRMPWPGLSAQQMRDLLTYAATASPRKTPPALRIGDPESGRKILQMKQCTVCHPSAATYEFQTPHTLTGLAAVLWNHAPMMTSLPPSLNRDEIADLVAWLWSARYFEQAGRASRGRTVFDRNRCAACHQSFPPSAAWDAASLLAAAWKHTPQVIAGARAKQIPWPAFADREMADLIAYLNSIRRPPLLK